MGESYTLHSPENIPPAAANQMSFGHREVSIVGHWPITSRIPERSGLSGRASELLLRNAISRRISSGWGISPSYHLPTTVEGRLRIGKKADHIPQVDAHIATSPHEEAPIDGPPDETHYQGETCHLGNLSEPPIFGETGDLFETQETEMDIFI